MGDSKQRLDSPRKGEIVIFTDGSCLGNPGSGGWCAVVEVPGREGLVVLTGGEPETTNNRMELIGAIEGLKEVRRLIERGEVPAETPIHLYSDSSYLVKGVEEWLEGWERKGFKKVKNRELWEELARLKKGLNLRLHWVKGHDGVERNEKCDLVAREMAQFFKNNR